MSMSHDAYIQEEKVSSKIGGIETIDYSMVDTSLFISPQSRRGHCRDLSEAA